MNLSAGFVCVSVLAAVLCSPAIAAAHKVTETASLGRITNYVGTPAGIVGAGSVGGAAAKSGPAADAGSGAVEIPEPAVIALFGLVALAIGHRLRRSRA